MPTQPPQPDPACAPPAVWWRLPAYAALCIAIAAGLPLIPGLPRPLAVAIGTLATALATMAVVWAAAAPRLRAWHEAVGCALFLAAWYLLPAGRAVPPDLRLIAGGLTSVLFTLACACLGRLVGRIVREPNILVPVCLVAGIADVYTVFWGPTSHALTAAPKLVQKLSVAIPEVGSAAGPQGVQGLAALAFLGLGDLIFAALFFSAAARFGLGLKRTYWAVVGAMVVGMFAVLFLPPIAGLPLLPFIVAGFLIANGRSLRLSRQEWGVTAVGILLLVLVLIAAAFMQGKLLPRH